MEVIEGFAPVPGKAEPHKAWALELGGLLLGEMLYPPTGNQTITHVYIHIHICYAYVCIYTYTSLHIHTYVSCML